MGESIAASLGANPQGVTKILAWMVRATFLDPRIARSAALDVNGTKKAIGAIALTAAPGAVLGLLGAGSLGGVALTVVLSAGSIAVAAYALSALSQEMVGMKLPPALLLRVTAYALGANMLGFIPTLGQIAALWSIPASMAAVREVTGAETQKVAIFMGAWYLITIVSGMVIGPLLRPVLSIL
jgi:hypothetical protein